MVYPARRTADPCTSGAVERGEKRGEPGLASGEDDARRPPRRFAGSPHGAAPRGTAAYSHRVFAIVPVKGRDAKSRLDGLLSPTERARLVEAMLADVLAACEAAESSSHVLVVTPEPEIVPDGVDVLVDDGKGHADAVARALADERAASGALVVMGDCPLAAGESLDRLARRADPVALVAADDGGMNALALRTSASFTPAFGVPNAAAVTVERARAVGIEPAIVDDPALAFDVDQPADVWKLREHERRGRAHAALAEMLPPTGGLL